MHVIAPNMRPLKASNAPAMSVEFTFLFLQRNSALNHSKLQNVNSLYSCVCGHVFLFVNRVEKNSYVL